MVHISASSANSVRLGGSILTDIRVLQSLVETRQALRGSAGISLLSIRCIRNSCSSVSERLAPSGLTLQIKSLPFT